MSEHKYPWIERVKAFIRRVIKIVADYFGIPYEPIEASQN